MREETTLARSGADNLGAQPSRRVPAANWPGAGIDSSATRSRVNVCLPLERQARRGAHRHRDHTLYEGRVGREGPGKASTLLPSDEIAIDPDRDVLVVAGVRRPQVGIATNNGDAIGRARGWDRAAEGSAGILSPNAAFVETVIPVPMGTAPGFILQWKTNIDARSSGARIYAGAGPIGVRYSPTRLSAEIICS